MCAFVCVVKIKKNLLQGNASERKTDNAQLHTGILRAWKLHTLGHNIQHPHPFIAITISVKDCQ